MELKVMKLVHFDSHYYCYCLDCCHLYSSPWYYFRYYCFCFHFILLFGILVSTCFLAYHPLVSFWATMEWTEYSYNSVNKISFGPLAEMILCFILMLLLLREAITILSLKLLCLIALWILCFFDLLIHLLLSNMICCLELCLHFRTIKNQREK